MTNNIMQSAWYGTTILLGCKDCDRKENCTIQDLVNCARSFEEWLEENAI